MRQIIYFFIFSISFALSISSCGNREGSLSINDFNVLTNFNLKADSLVLEMDLNDGPFYGITLPSQNGLDGDSVFQFQFKIKNNENTEQQFAYKIYFQNESYKHAEADSMMGYNIKSAENFYGSWIGDSLIGFKTSPTVLPNDSIEISDTFTISGNPLNLEQFHGVNPLKSRFTQEDIKDAEERIMGDSVWYASIIKKAEVSKKTIERQLTLDAIWFLQNHLDDGQIENQRWQNNPRVGKYEFMLVIGPIDEIAKLPNYVLNPQNDIDTIDVRMNPFYYFKNELKRKEFENIIVLESDQKLRTFATLRPNSGYYYDPFEFTDPIIPNEEKGSSSYESYKTAHFEQYLNNEDKDSSLHNINLAANIGGVDYTLEDFYQNRENAKRNIPSYVAIPIQPLVNSYLDKENGRIIVANPGNAKKPYKKESAGVEGRFGFTYGKFRARIQFPETLSKQGVWNGVTCAFWLKFHSAQDWNLRDECGNEGYLESGSPQSETVRIPRTTYSEIDIEIVKASRNWPLSSYENPDSTLLYDASADGNLMVTCTNWDWACQEPSQFNVGVQDFNSPTNSYQVHRWNHWYKALTLKTEKPHSETVGDIYQYEIDWRPTKIIWRIGENIEEMTEVGYMDSSITKIPNNQMTTVMSQEFHYGHWWPTTPYPQGDIPYPSNPIQGALYEIVIE